MPATDPAWADLLADLEHDVAVAEQLVQDLAGGGPLGGPLDEAGPAGTPWQPPAGLGPLPQALATRVRDLVARQRRAARDLAAATAPMRRQVRYADHVVDLTGHQPPRPAYLDVQA